MLPPTKQPKKGLVRKFSLSHDDPFGHIFDSKKIEQELLNPPRHKSCCKHSGPPSNRQSVRLDGESQLSENENMQFFPPYDGTEDSKKYGDFENEDNSSDEEGSKEGCCQHAYWRNAAYWRLPENVRHAIDVAKMKSKHSEFWYRLQTLNDKIYIYRSVFYSRMPAYQKQFMEKKQQELEKKLKEERVKFEFEMNQMNAKMKKKLKSTRSLIPSNASLILKASELQESKQSTEKLISGDQGITAMEMVKNLKKKSSKKLVNVEVRARILPKRAHSMTVKGLQRRYHQQEEDSHEDDTGPSTTDNVQRVNPRVNFPLQIKVDKAPDANQIKEADEADEAMTPAVPGQARRFNQNKSNHSSPLPHHSLSEESDDEHSLQDSVSPNTEKRKGSSKYVLVTKESIEIKKQMSGKSPCLSAKESKRKSQKEVLYVSSPVNAITQKKESNKIALITGIKSQPPESMTSNYFSENRYASTAQKNASTTMKLNQLQYRMKIRSRLFKSIDGAIIEAKKMVSNTATPVKPRAQIKSRPLNNVIMEHRYSKPITASALKKLKAPDPRQFPAISQVDKLSKTVVLNDFNYSRVQQNSFQKPHSTAGTSMVMSELASIQNGLDTRIYHRGKSSETLGKPYGVSNDYKIINGRLVKTKKNKKQTGRNQILQSGANMASKAYKVPATEIMVMFDQQKSKSMGRPCKRKQKLPATDSNKNSVLQIQQSNSSTYSKKVKPMKQQFLSQKFGPTS